MFRELTRKKQKMTESECIEVLTREKRGVLALNGDDGYPYAMPMNHFYNGDDGCIYFHCGKKGYRADCLERSNKVSFCVYDKGCANDGQWALNVKSVIVFGTLEPVYDADVIRDITYRLSLKFTSDEHYIKNEIAQSIKATALLKLNVQNMCGKLVNES